MCGLVGMAGDMTFRHKSAFKTMLFFNTLRGADSTGVTVYDSEKRTVLTRKSTVPGFDFIAAPDFDIFLGYPLGVWLGHGRARTIGNVSRANAHPFEVRDDDDGITMFGAHNGTLRNQAHIEDCLGADRFGTDSEALLNLIANYGAKEAIKEVEGAWALAWWHYEDDTVNLLRNKERPLYYALSEDEKVLLWASEAWMIRIACEREGIELQTSKTGNPLIWGLPDDTLFTWKLPTDRKSSFGEPTREGGLCGKPAPVAVSRFPTNEVDWQKLDDATAAAKKATEEAAKAGKGAGANEPKTAVDCECVGFEGEPLTRGYVEAMKASGCDWCEESITTDDFAWMDENSIVCRRCLRGEHTVVDVATGTIHDRLLRVVVTKKENVG